MDWPIPESLPRAPAERIEAFVKKYSGSNFAHSVDVLRLMSRNSAEESRISVYDVKLNDGLRSTYRVRADLLASRASSPPYPDSLTQDVGALAERLEAALDQAIAIWSIGLPDGTVFMIFDLVRDGVIAGSVKSVDRRVVAPSGSSA
jgi:hypothetical protein